jgi:hypothetical protein
MQVCELLTERWQKPNNNDGTNGGFHAPPATLEGCRLPRNAAAKQSRRSTCSSTTPPASAPTMPGPALARRSPHIHIRKKIRSQGRDNTSHATRAHKCHACACLPWHRHHAPTRAHIPSPGRTRVRTHVTCPHARPGAAHTARTWLQLPHSGEEITGGPDLHHHAPLGGRRQVGTELAVRAHRLRLQYSLCTRTPGQRQQGAQ